MRFAVQQSGDLRREHLETEGADGEGKDGASAPHEKRRPERARRIDPGQSAPCTQRDPALHEPRRKPGRSFPGGVHRPHQGDRPLRRGPGRALFHLRRPHDHRRDTPLSAGQQQHPREPFPAGHGLPGHAGEGEDDRKEQPGADGGGDRESAGSPPRGGRRGAGIHRGAGFPLRARVLRRRGHHLCDGSGRRQ